jgi:NRPS condensation-like uncharacterized protein
MVRCIRLSNTTLKKQYLEQAVTRIQQRHALLQANGNIGAYMNNTEPIFEKSNVPIPITFESRNSEDQYIQTIEQELNIGWTNDKPLMRLRVLQNDNGNSELILAISHFIADGRSLTNLVIELLRNYVDISKSENDKQLSQIQRLPWVNNLERFLIPFSYTSLNDLKSLLSFVPTLLKIQFAKKLELPKENKNPPPLSERTTSIYLQSLLKEDSSNIKTLCKQQDVTIGNLITATSLQAFKQIYGDTEEKSNIAYVVYVDARTRGVESIGAEYLAPMMLVCPNIAIINKSDSIWDIAKQSNLQLAQVVNSRLPELFSTMISPKEFADTLSGRKTKEQINVGISFSNLGVISIPDDILSELKITEMRVCTGANLSLNPTILITSATVNGKMLFTFSYSTPLFKRSSITRFADTVVQLLQKCSQQKL